MDLYRVNTGFLRSSDTRSAEDLYFCDNCMLPVMQMGDEEADSVELRRGWLL